MADVGRQGDHGVGALLLRMARKPHGQFFDGRLNADDHRALPACRLLQDHFRTAPPLLFHEQKEFRGQLRPHQAVRPAAHTEAHFALEVLPINLIVAIERSLENREDAAEFLQGRCRREQAENIRPGHKRQRGPGQRRATHEVAPAESSSHPSPPDQST